MHDSENFDVNEAFGIDRTAPRMPKGQFRTHILNEKLFKEFKKSHPEYKKMTWKEFKDAWLDIAETIRTETVMNPLGVKLGFYLGELKCQFLPYKYKALDRDASGKEGHEVNHLSILTRGKTGKIKWERRWAVSFNRMLQFYGFEATQKIKDLAEVYIPENPEKIRISRNTLGGKRTWR